MTTKQNIAAAANATAWDVAKLIVQGLAGQRSSWSKLEPWSGREFRAVMEAAEALLPLYQGGMMPEELAARLGRSML